MVIEAIVWLIGPAAWLIYDVYALATSRRTLSRFVWEKSKLYPLIPFLSGMLMGHLFWR